MIWWSGGNPFHHHQDLNRLLRGWNRADTDRGDTSPGGPPSRAMPTSCCRRPPRWSATTSAARSRDRFVRAMHQAIAPVGQARNDARHLRRHRRCAGLPRPPSPSSATRWPGCSTSTAAGARPAPRRASRCRISTTSGTRATSRSPPPPRPYTQFADFRADPEATPAQHAIRQGRDLLRDHRLLRLRRSRRPSGLARTARMARRPTWRGASRCTCCPSSPRRGCTASSTTGRVAAANTRAGARADPDAPRRRRRARAGRRRPRARLQRSRRRLRRAAHDGRTAAAASSRWRPAPGSNPLEPGVPAQPLRARQPERADAGCRHLAPRPGIGRAILPGAGRALDRASRRR